MQEVLTLHGLDMHEFRLLWFKEHQPLTTTWLKFQLSQYINHEKVCKCKLYC